MVVREERYRFTGRIHDPSNWGAAGMALTFTLGISEFALFPNYLDYAEKMEQETHDVVVWYDAQDGYAFHYASFEPDAPRRKAKRHP